MIVRIMIYKQRHCIDVAAVLIAPYAKAPDHQCLGLLSHLLSHCQSLCCHLNRQSRLKRLKNQ